MSKILKRIRADLKYAMEIEIKYRKKGVIVFLANSKETKTAYNIMIAQKTVSRAIISMFPETGKKSKDITDDDIIKLLKKYINQEKERRLYELKFLKEADVSGKTPAEVKKIVKDKIQKLDDKLISHNIKIAKKYLPAQVNKEEIIRYIKGLDMSRFKNKMQAMGPIMKRFKGSDGNFIKNILLNL